MGNRALKGPFLYLILVLLFLCLSGHWPLEMGHRSLALAQQPPEAAPPSQAPPSPQAPPPPQTLPPSQAPLPADPVQRGQVLLGQGNLEEAEKAFREAVQKSPNKPEPLYFLGVVYLQKGEAEKALEQFQKVLKLIPNHLLSHYNIGQAYLRLDKREEAIQAFQNALKIEPAFYPAYLELGLIYEGQEKVEEAVVAFKSVIQYGEKIPQAQDAVEQAKKRLSQTGDTPEKARQALSLFRRGQEFLEKNEWAEAQSSFEEILKMIPDNAVARYFLARVELEKGNIFKATRLLEMAAKIDLNAWQVYYLLGQLYEAQGRWSEATLVYLVVSKIITEGPINQDARRRLATLRDLLQEQKLRESIRKEAPLAEARQKFEQGISALQKGNAADAIGLLGDATKLDSTNPFYFYNLGIAYFSETKLVEATQAIQKTIELKKDFGPPHFFLAQIYVASGNAARDAGDLVGAYQEYLKSIAEFQTTLAIGAEQWQLDESKQQVTSLNETIGKFQEASGHTIVGTALSDRKDKEGALRELKLASDLVPQDPFTRISSGFVYEELGQIETAIQFYEEAGKMSPLNPNPHVYLGRLYEKQKKYEEAIKAYQIAKERSPRYPEAVIRLGSLYYDLERFDEAKAEYLKAIELNPKEPEPHFYIGQIYEKEGREKEAIQEYQTAQTLIQPDADIAKVIQAKLASLDRFSARWSHNVLSYNDNANTSKSNPIEEISTSFSIGFTYILVRTMSLHKLLPVSLTIPIDFSTSTSTFLRSSAFSNSESLSLSLQSTFMDFYDVGGVYNFSFSQSDEGPLAINHIWNLTAQRRGKIPTRVGIGLNYRSLVALQESTLPGFAGVSFLNDKFLHGLEFSMTQDLEAYGVFDFSYSYTIEKSPRLDQSNKAHSFSFGYSKSIFGNLNINMGLDYTRRAFDVPRAIFVTGGGGPRLGTLIQKSQTFTFRLGGSYPLGNGLIFSANYQPEINKSNLDIPVPTSEISRQELLDRPLESYQQNLFSFSIRKSF